MCGRRCSKRRCASSTICCGSSTSIARASTASCPTRGAASSATWFRGAGWHVIELRWGSRLRALFGRPGGERLRARLEGMGNAEYQSLLRLPPAGARKAVIATATGETDPAVDRLLADVLRRGGGRARGRRGRPRSRRRSSRPTRKRAAKRARALRHPGRHDQGLGLSLRRRSHEPQRAAHPAAARRAARRARRRGRRGVGRLRAGQRRGRADPPRARAVRAAGAPTRRGPRRARTSSRRSYPAAELDAGSLRPRPRPAEPPARRRSRRHASRPTCR